MPENSRRPLMYVGAHGTDNPTLATLPFLAASGAPAAEVDCCIVLVAEGAMLVKPGMIEAVHGVGFPPLSELAQRIRAANIPIHV